MTAEQLALDLAPLITPTYEPEATIQERYEAWLAANEWIVPAIATLLDDWSNHGGRRVGVKSAVEWIRFHYQRTIQPDDQGFRINNSYASRLSRTVVARYPHLASVIETRELRAA